MADRNSSERNVRRYQWHILADRRGYKPWAYWSRLGCEYGCRSLDYVREQNRSERFLTARDRTLTAYYNEIEPDAVAALRQLIVEGVVAPGDVDERSIKDVKPDDLKGYTQCHFFAGGGLWSVAARLAGWPDERPIWTGSCPCQPFSQAGQRAGTDDARHLWPDFHSLIRAARPPVVMGEQVAGKAGRNWFYGVRTDLEGSGYAGRAVDFPACAVDAPHERNRLYWIAVADTESQHGGRDEPQRGSQGRAVDWRLDAVGDMAHADASRLPRQQPGAIAGATGEDQGQAHQREWVRPDDRQHDDAGPVAFTDSGRETGRRVFGPGEGTSAPGERPHHQPRRSNGSWWADAEWIECHDGKARRAKRSIPLLVDGMVGRNGLWRLAGNSISPVAAAEVIGAFLDTENGVSI